MASPNPYPGGLNLSGTVFSGGGTVAAYANDYFSGSVQWLDTIGGSNANAGSEPEAPVKTLAQAVTNSAANGIIVIGAGSAETLGSMQNLNLANLTIIGCGSGVSRPRYTCSGAGIAMLQVSAAGVTIENLYFPASTGAASQRILVSAVSNAMVRDCYFECGSLDSDTSLSIGGGGANSTLVRGCTFAVTASRPSIGLGVGSAVTDTMVEDCVFDGGPFGWNDFALKVSAAATRLKFRNLQFVRRADLGITVTGTTYAMYGVTFAGTSRAQITA